MDREQQHHPAVRFLVVELERNASLGKNRHFRAADRCRTFSTALGVPVIVINVLLGSSFMVMLGEDLPDAAKWLGAFLGLIAAGLGGVLTFFNFGKKVAGHREVANRYLEIQMGCQKTLALFEDGLLTPDELATEGGALQSRYHEVNTAAEAFPTGRKEFRAALKLERLRQEALAVRHGVEKPADVENGIARMEEALRR